MKLANKRRQAVEMWWMVMVVLMVVLLAVHRLRHNKQRKLRRFFQNVTTTGEILHSFSEKRPSRAAMEA
jgi:high-affinity Fe2+/Pb2+ permease